MNIVPDSLQVSDGAEEDKRPNEEQLFRRTISAVCGGAPACVVPRALSSQVRCNFLQANKMALYSHLPAKVVVDRWDRLIKDPFPHSLRELALSMQLREYIVTKYSWS